MGGRAIKTLGEVLKTRRQQVYVALKANFRDLDTALQDLKTDYVDFIMFDRHSASSAGDAGVLELFEKYKQQGKVRYPGLTTHGDVKAATRVGIESEMYLLAMPTLNQPQLEAMDHELRLARERQVGIMAMKTMKGLDSRDLELAYLKKVLSNPAVTTVLKGIGSFDMFDAYLKAAKEGFTLAEDQALYRHAQLKRSQNCMMCDQCKQACPSTVEVSTILRCKEYYLDQLGDPQTALATYREVPRGRLGDGGCYSCRKCEQVCPNGLPIVEKLASAKRILNHYA
jgi:predicted aldo/keto reductase-like oxidoreductase